VADIPPRLARVTGQGIALPVSVPVSVSVPAARRLRPRPRSRPESPPNASVRRRHRTAPSRAFGAPPGRRLRCGGRPPPLSGIAPAPDLGAALRSSASSGRPPGLSLLGSHAHRGPRPTDGAMRKLRFRRRARPMVPPRSAKRCALAAVALRASAAAHDAPRPGARKRATISRRLAVLATKPSAQRPADQGLRVVRSVSVSGRSRPRSQNCQGRHVRSAWPLYRQSAREDARHLRTSAPKRGHHASILWSLPRVELKTKN